MIAKLFMIVFIFWKIYVDVIVKRVLLDIHLRIWLIETFGK